MEAFRHMQRKDIKIKELIPLNTRNINLETNNKFKKILSSIRVVGILEPLIVYPEGKGYIILDGYLRYKACQILEIEEAPCFIYYEKEAYTFNRMVNSLSAVQENKMLKKALNEVKPEVIAQVFGMKASSISIDKRLFNYLDPEVIKVLDEEKISKKCARELSKVNTKRQIEIINEMKKTGDFSLSFAKALVLKTPTNQLNPKKRQAILRMNERSKKNNLVKELQEAEKSCDFYSNLYRQYSTDLVKLCIYIRRLLDNHNIKSYIHKNYPEIFKNFEKIACLSSQIGDKEEGKVTDSHTEPSKRVVSGNIQ